MAAAPNPSGATAVMGEHHASVVFSCVLTLDTPSEFLLGEENFIHALDPPPSLLVRSDLYFQFSMGHSLQLKKNKVKSLFLVLGGILTLYLIKKRQYNIITIKKKKNKASIPYERHQHAFSVKGQIIDNLGFAGHEVSVATTRLCRWEYKSSHRPR